MLANSAKLKIYYYFMLCDGEIQTDEKKLFESICSSMNISMNEKNEIIEYCNKKISNLYYLKCNDYIFLIKEVLNDRNSYNSLINMLFYINISNEIKTNKNEEVELLWNFINLSYANEEIHENERKIIDFFINFWEIDSAIVSELFDTVETISVLIKQKQDIKKSRNNYDEITNVLNNIDKDIERLSNNIQITISEANI